MGGAAVASPVPLGGGAGAAMDAFGSTDNAPLSAMSLGGGGSNGAAAVDDDDDDFGGFSDAAPVAAAPVPLQPQQPEATGMGLAALDMFGATADAPLPGLGGGSQDANGGDDDDDFGGFNDAAQAPEPIGLAALDMFGATADAPLPVLGVSQDANDDDNDFGGFSDAAAAPAPVSQSSGPMGLAALDMFGPTPDAPLPGLGGGSQDANDGDDDDFGGFADAAEAPSQQAEPMGLAALDMFGATADAPLPGLGGGSQDANDDDDDDNFGGFSDAAAAPVPASQPSQQMGIAALDMFGATPDAAPLPGLGGGSQDAGDDDDDDFGGFADAAAPTPEATGMAALDMFGATPDAPLPGLGGASQDAGDDDDDFGGFTDAPSQQPETTDMAALDMFGAAADAPLPGLGGGSQDAGDDDDDDFGGFADAAPQQQQQPQPSGMDAFDLLAGVQDAPLPSFGTVQPQSERGVGLTSTSPVPPSVHPSLSFPGTSNSGGVDLFADGASGNTPASAISGMDAFDAFGPPQDAPLPSFGSRSQGTASVASSEDMADAFDSSKEGQAGADDPNNTSLSSFSATDPTAKGRRRFSGQLRRKSSRKLNASPDNETVPKDLMPSMPGEKYSGPVRKNSMRKLPEFSDKESDSDADDQEDPFAGIDPAPGGSSFDSSFSKPISLNELSTSSINPKEERVPQDLKPHAPGEHYVLHSKNSASTPGGLLNLNESQDEDNDDDAFGDFEAPPQAPQVPGVNPASEPDPFATSSPRSPGGHLKGHTKKIPADLGESAPKDLMPSLPGTKYVENVRRNSLQKLPEFSDKESESDEDGGQGDPFAGLDPAPGGSSFDTLSKSITLNEPINSLDPMGDALPQDLKPHAKGEHYVIHGRNSFSGGLINLDESQFEDDDFGDFEEAPAENQLSGSQPDHFSTSMPHELTPHAPGEHYVQHQAHATTTPGGLSTVAETPDDPFRQSAAVESHLSHLNPALQLSRSDDAAPQDLQPHEQGAHYVPHEPQATSTPGGLATVGESLDEIAPGDFGDFASPPLPAPTQLSRQATPSPQDLQPISKKPANVLESATIVEEDESDDFGDFNDTAGAPEGTSLQEEKDEKASDASSTASPDPFAAFDSLAPAQPCVPPLSSFNAAPPTGSAEVNTDILAGFASGPEKSIASPNSALHGSRSQNSLLSDDDSNEEGAKAPVAEGNEPKEDDDFGDFTDAPPDLTRQATPAVQDLKPLTQKSSAGAFADAAITEEGHEEADDDEWEALPPFLRRKK